jgi:hypothetical protein
MQPGTGFYHSPAQSQHQPLLSGAMDAAAPNMMSSGPSNASSTGGPGFSMFTPQAPQQQQQQNNTMTYLGEEAPLLEELGVDVPHILAKTKAVVLPFSRFSGGSAPLNPKDIIESADMAGECRMLFKVLNTLMVFLTPLAVFVTFGFCRSHCIWTVVGCRNDFFRQTTVWIHLWIRAFWMHCNDPCCQFGCSTQSNSFLDSRQYLGIFLASSQYLGTCQTVCH